MTTLRKILFYRDFRCLTGGHLKVFHYFQHFQSFPEFAPDIFFSPHSRWDRDNPWATQEPSLVSDWRPDRYDVLFLAGMDWSMLPLEAASGESPPVINLIQGVRHSDVGSSLREYLAYPAIRICVSQQVADAITSTNEVNGPVYVIPNGIEDIYDRGRKVSQSPIDILIVGNKNPDLANDIYGKLYVKYSCQNLAKVVPREELISLMQKSRVTICLPGQREGFYLPALESMAAGSLVICPDCVGNRDFCHDGWNMLKPRFKPSHIVKAAQRALSKSDMDRAVMQENARVTAARHTLTAERRMLRSILSQYPNFFGPMGVTMPKENQC